MKKLLEPVSQTHRNISKIHIVDMATSTAQSFVPRGASARACGAAHIAAQQGNTGSLKLLFDLDRIYLLIKSLQRGSSLVTEGWKYSKWYQFCWLVYRADSSPIEGWVLCWSCKYIVCLFSCMQRIDWRKSYMLNDCIIIYDIFHAVVILFCPCYFLFALFVIQQLLFLGCHGVHPEVKISKTRRKIWQPMYSLP